MPLLMYCIAEAAANVPVPSTGLQGQPMQAILESGLTAFASEYHASANDANIARSAALDFNRVLQELLQQGAIIPFRFPTIIASASEMTSFLQEHGAEYSSSLIRLRDTVQMEINLSLEAPAQDTEPQPSGTAYLMQRQSRHRQLSKAGGLFRDELAQHIKDWRQREGPNAARCFVLIPRGKSALFLEQVTSIQLPPGVRARVTGPWPATEFLKEKQ